LTQVDASIEQLIYSLFDDEVEDDELMRIIVDSEVVDDEVDDDE
jgi:hypothetical protein